MGAFTNAFASYRLATTRQRELRKSFAEIGVNFMHLDTKFTKPWLQEAMETDAATVAAKYVPLVRYVTITEGHTVTPTFNSRVARMWEAMKDDSPGLAR
jgi:hypothetical protein